MKWLSAFWKARGKDQFVLLSYLNENSVFIGKTFENLNANGVEVWMDKRSTSPGAHWAESFETALEKATHVISFFSDHANSGPRVFLDEQTKISARLGRRRPPKFIPVRLEDCRIPDLNYCNSHLSKMHLLDLFGVNAELNYLKMFEGVGVAVPTLVAPPDGSVRFTLVEHKTYGVQIYIDPASQSVFVGRGETVEVSLAPGKYTMQAWIESPTFEGAYENESPNGLVFAKSAPLNVEISAFEFLLIEVFVEKEFAHFDEGATFRVLARAIGLKIPKQDESSSWPATIRLTVRTRGKR
ncbi:MAG: toll/interleukin-1 receptor domain-containing protein [Hyphomonas sp.]